MGAALTYARRYALFTLVGIAGEDDLDAPNLVAPTPTNSLANAPKVHRRTGGNSGDHRARGRTAGGDDAKRAESVSRQGELSTALSASLREELLREIEALDSSDDAALWSLRRLGAKNTLVASDAAVVEQAFRARLTVFGTEPPVGAVRQQDEPENRRGIKAESDELLWSIKPCWHYRCNAAFAIESTSKMSPNSLASSVAGGPPMPIICVSLKHQRSDARSAMSLRCHSVGGTIAKSIAMAMKLRGGPGLGSTRPLPLESSG